MSKNYPAVYRSASFDLVPSVPIKRHSHVVLCWIPWQNVDL